MATKAKRRSSGKRAKRKRRPFEYTSWKEGTDPVKRKVETFVLNPFLILTAIGFGLFFIFQPKDGKDYTMMPGRSGKFPRRNPETGRLEYDYEDTEITDEPVQIVEPPVELDAESTDVQA